MEIKHTPTALFRSSWVLEGAKVARLKDSILNQTPLQQSFIEQLRHYPHLLSPFITKGLIPDSVVHEILDTPDRIYRMMVADYENLKTRFEPHLTSDLETVERLVKMFIDAEKYGLEITPLAESYFEYFRILRADPNRLLRVSNEPDEIRKELLEISMPEIARSPAHAYFFLVESDARNIPDEILKLISTSQEYSALTRVKFSDSIEVRQRTILESGMVQPKWIYHILSNLDAKELPSYLSLKEHLSRDLAWAVEYMTDLVQRDLNAALEIRDNITGASRNSGLVPELIAWQATMMPVGLKLQPN